MVTLTTSLHKGKLGDLARVLGHLRKILNILNKSSRKSLCLSLNLLQGWSVVSNFKDVKSWNVAGPKPDYLWPSFSSSIATYRQVRVTLCVCPNILGMLGKPFGMYNRPPVFTKTKAKDVLRWSLMATAGIDQLCCHPHSWRFHQCIWKRRWFTALFCSSTIKAWWNYFTVEYEIWIKLCSQPLGTHIWPQNTFYAFRDENSVFCIDTFNFFLHMVIFNFCL